MIDKLQMQKLLQSVKNNLERADLTSPIANFGPMHRDLRTALAMCAAGDEIKVPKAKPVKKMGRKSNAEKAAAAQAAQAALAAATQVAHETNGATAPLQ